MTDQIKLQIDRVSNQIKEIGKILAENNNVRITEENQKKINEIIKK